jgi:hypothetical protein
LKHCDHPERLRIGRTVIAERDATSNDRNDTLIINKLYPDRVDLLITEDRGIHTKAARLGLADRTITIDAYLEKVTAENPTLVEYKVLSVKRQLSGNIDIQDPFPTRSATTTAAPHLTSCSTKRATSLHTSASNVTMSSHSSTSPVQTSTELEHEPQVSVR